MANNNGELLATARVMKCTDGLFGILTLMAALAPQVNAQDWLTNGLVAYYPFNGNANDESGNGNNAVSHGAQLATNRFGVVSNSYSFANGAYVETTNSVGFPISTNDFTVSLWISSTEAVSNKYQTIFCNRSLAQFQLVINPMNRAVFPWPGSLGYITGAGGVGHTNDCNTDALAWETNRWYNVQVVRAANIISIYRDSVLLAESYTTNGNNAPQASRVVDFGFRKSTSEFPLCGKLDDIRIYSRAFSPQEVKGLYDFEWPDSDHDGLSDYEEIDTYHTDPNKRDTDGDYLSDYQEVRVYRTNPLNPDSDGDGYNDYAEIYAGKNPNDVDDHPAANLSAFTAIELEFISKTNTSFFIQASPDLVVWTNFEGPISGDGNIWKKTYTTRESGRQYYRVELAP